jgi:hypothetical protein
MAHSTRSLGGGQAHAQQDLCCLSASLSQQHMCPHKIVARSQEGRARQFRWLRCPTGCGVEIAEK